ncbi:MAG TPA: hypothetical protein ENJ50_07580, partial [Planctomycetaceae bacterium]|nr:hypothetical protein [Planctomycetaceae bacterium]
RLWEKGLLGERISVHETRDVVTEKRYRPMTFNLIVIDGAHPAWYEAARRWVRPWGGCFLADRVPSWWKEVEGDAGERVAGYRVWRRGAPSGAGEWTHPYADESGTVCSRDARVAPPYRLMWFGRPGPRHMYDRHWKAVPPLFREGRLYVIGRDWLAGVDAYNGTMLWERAVPGAGRVALLRDCGNMVVDRDNRVWVAADERAVVLDGASGDVLATLPVRRYAGREGHWGWLSASGEVVLGTAQRAEAEMKESRTADYRAVWENDQPVVTGFALFGLDRQDMRPLWKYTPQKGAIVNPTLMSMADAVFFVESGNPKTLAHPTGRIRLAELFSGPARPELVAVDKRAGKVLWRQPLDLAPVAVNAVYLQGADGMLVVTGTRVATLKGKQLIQYRLIAVDAKTGSVRWQTDDTPSHADKVQGGHGEQTQHPAIVEGIVYGPGFARVLETGKPHDGWRWQKSPKCTPVALSRYGAFSRWDGRPTGFVLKDGKMQALTTVSRPACYLNILPVGGIVLVPEGSSGCTCGYSIQASLAFYPER